MLLLSNSSRWYKRSFNSILCKLKIPILASFRPGHIVEAEVLSKMGIWGLYADSRFENVHVNENASELYKMNFPLIADINNNIKFCFITFICFLNSSMRFNPFL